MRETVHAVVLDVARDRGGTLDRVEDRQQWTVELGLRSLDLAEVVATLEETLGVDPFLELVPITSIRTVGDLVAAYEKALTGGAANDTQASDAARRRGEQRRMRMGRSAEGERE